MGKQTKKIVIAASFGFSLLLLIVLVNQIVQLTSSISAIHPAAGQIIIAGILIGIVISILIPVIMFFRLSSPLIPPKEQSGKEYDKYIRKLSKNLEKNPYVTSSKTINSTEEVETALEELNHVSKNTIQNTGKRAFFTTAISQNGALDALFVLGLQFKLIWDIAHIYNQRPTLRDMSFLYSNVLITAVIATQIDEAEYFEMVESAISKGVGSAISVIPGTSLIVNSALTGASNSFLTLRVGAITQEYCCSLTRPKRTNLRNSATSKAAKMLTGVVSEGSYKLVYFMGSAPFKKIYESGSDLTNKMKDYSKSLFISKKDSGPEDKL